MKGKDILDSTSSPLTLQLAFRIPFTKTVLVVCTGRVTVKPHEDQATRIPVERRSEDDRFDGWQNYAGKLARAINARVIHGEARRMAAAMLGVKVNMIESGVTPDGCWISWNGIRWQAVTWNLVLQHVAQYARATLKRKEVKPTSPIIDPAEVKKRLDQGGKN